MSSLSIGAIALSHFDVDGNKITASTPTNLPINKYVVYAGVGLTSSGYQRGGPSVGMLKSENGGRTWTRLGTREFYGVDFHAIVPFENDPKKLLVAAHTPAKRPKSRNAGVWLSVDGGESWEQVFKGEFSHLAGDPGNASRSSTTVSPSRRSMRSRATELTTTSTACLIPRPRRTWTRSAPTATLAS